MGERLRRTMIHLLPSFDSRDLIMGIDLSTQSVKCGVFTAGNMVEVGSATVNYHDDFPGYKTDNGIHLHKDGFTVTSPTMMFVEAVELALTRLKKKIPGALSKVKTVSASGQQHGSVYWRKGARERLTSMNPAKCMKDQLVGIFSVEDSPIWMDSSTTIECRELEKNLGGAQKVASLSGSRAYERFTGNQIKKIWKEKPLAYQLCERISLISSFVVSLLLGDYAPIDVSDGSGMNLLDIRSHRWSHSLLQATAPNLANKLGVPVLSNYYCGNVSRYMQKRFGFSSDCCVIAGSGDNPCSLAGLMVSKPGDVCISLGTSDTLFAVVRNPLPGVEGHILCSPVHRDAYMAMLCFKNGSFVREWCSEKVADSSWTRFSDLLASCPTGNNGYFGFYFKEPEIIPACKAVIHRVGSSGETCEHFDAATEVRALIESQFLNMKAHAEAVGLSHISRIIATGGASQNNQILQVLSDIFGVPVYVAESGPDTALTGAALRALHGLLCQSAERYLPFYDLHSLGPKLILKCRPKAYARGIYDDLMKRRCLEEAKLLKTHKL